MPASSFSTCRKIEAETCPIRKKLGHYLATLPAQINNKPAFFSDEYIQSVEASLAPVFPIPENSMLFTLAAFCFAGMAKVVTATAAASVPKGRGKTKAALRCFEWVVTISGWQFEVQFPGDQTDHGLEVTG